MVMTPTQALTVDLRTQAWGAGALQRDDRPTGPTSTAGWPAKPWPPAPGWSPRPWPPACCATRAGRVAGVRTDRPDGDLRARVVIACDGVNSFLAKEAGLLPPADAAHYTLGVKEVLALPARRHRGALRPGPRRGTRHRGRRLHAGHPGRRLPLHQPRHRQRRGGGVGDRAGGVGGAARGADRRLQGPSGDRPVAQGGRRSRSTRPPHPRGRLRRHAGAGRPTGCWSPGDAAGMTLAAGIWLEGVNFAIGSGPGRRAGRGARPWRRAT